jgi:hypothetical protein
MVINSTKRNKHNNKPGKKKEGVGGMNAPSMPRQGGWPPARQTNETKTWFVYLPLHRKRRHHSQLSGLSDSS